MVARDLVAMGLGHVHAMLVSALRRMPPPVVHHVVHRCWLIGISRDFNGWCAQAPPFHPSHELQIIMLDAKTLSGPELWTVSAHEVAHAWLLPAVPPESAPTIHERKEHAEQVARLSREWRLPNPDVKHADRAERLAVRLAASWGFPDDEDECADSGRALAACPSRW